MRLIGRLIGNDIYRVSASANQVLLWASDIRGNFAEKRCYAYRWNRELVSHRHCRPSEHHQLQQIRWVSEIAQQSGEVSLSIPGPVGSRLPRYKSFKEGHKRIEWQWIWLVGVLILNGSILNSHLY
ncbi:hypothetical protein Tco_0476398 [Tanacetum coccineum]